MKPKIGIASSVLAVSGTVLAIAALSPDEWADRLGSWWGVVVSLAPFLLGLIIGAAAIGAVSLVRANRQTVEAAQSDGVHLLTSAEYESESRAAIDSREFTLIKVFGYTGETALNDIFKYDDRYRGDLEVRFLHRSWLAEAEDEARHNARYPELRPWSKSGSIERAAGEVWEHPLKRQTRYFDGQPVIKGLIMQDIATRKRVAFVSYFRYFPEPPGGGSCFKGIGMPFLRVDDSTEQSREYIDMVESQFDYLWEHSSTKTSILNAHG